VFRDGDDLDLQSRNKKPLLRYFPELREPLLEQLPDRVVLDGELVVANERGLDFDALQLRQHPAASRVNKLAVEIPASYVAFDLLALDDRSLLEVAFAERRAELERIFLGARPPLYLTPATRDRDTAIDWFSRFEGAGFDGVVAKALADGYHPGKRSMLKVKHERSCDCVVAGYRVHKDGNGVGSFLLGLYDDDGVLHHVGVASAMAAKLRTELEAEVEPLRANALVDHPWQSWAESMATAEPGQRMPGGPSRWNATKDLSWEPLRIERVCEVDYEGMMNGRFRHNARFRRWRPDKDPSDCTYAQLETVPPAELREMFSK
jgi:ATP-dependent DNA ligase